MSIKLVYADKKTSDTKRYLYASETGIPSATDEKVVYTPDFSIDEKPFVYNKMTDNGKAGFAVGTSTRQIPSDSDTVTVASAYGVNIINGETVVPPVTKYTITVTDLSDGFAEAKLIFAGTSKDVYYAGQEIEIPENTEVTISATPESEEAQAVSAVVDNVQVTMTKSGQTYTGKFTVTKNASLKMFVLFV